MSSPKSPIHGRRQLLQPNRRNTCFTCADIGCRRCLAELIVRCAQHQVQQLSKCRLQRVAALDGGCTKLATKKIHQHGSILPGEWNAEKPANEMLHDGV